jgi:hypothetical protein
MCDYSLHAVASRPARAGDTLITTSFPGTVTRGFCSKDDATMAICLRPGTEIAFREEPQRDGIFAFLIFFGYGRIGSDVARFRKLRLDQPTYHHDALEFANGKTVYVHSLREGQQAVVVQLPVDEGAELSVNRRAAAPATNPADV